MIPPGLMILHIWLLVQVIQNCVASIHGVLQISYQMLSRVPLIPHLYVFSLHSEQFMDFLDALGIANLAQGAFMLPHVNVWLERAARAVLVRVFTGDLHLGIALVWIDSLTQLHYFLILEPILIEFIVIVCTFLILESFQDLSVLFV